MAAEFVQESRDLDSRNAHGFAFARAIGFQIVLATLPALVFFVAAAAQLEADQVEAAGVGPVDAEMVGSITANFGFDERTT